jgi:hypothetical protein
MNAKMNARIKRQLEAYCDLTPSMLAALDDPDRGHPNSLSTVVNLFTDPSQRVGVTVTTSPTGSPTASSPRLTMLDLLLAQARGEIQVIGRAQRRSRVAPVSELQLGMF